MLQYKKIDVSEGIDTKKTSLSKECMLCHFWYFKDGYKFEPHVSNKCHCLWIKKHWDIESKRSWF